MIKASISNYKVNQIADHNGIISCTDSLPRIWYIF